MDTQDIQTTLHTEKDRSSKKEQKTTTERTLEDLRRTAQREVEIYEADEMDYLG